MRDNNGIFGRIFSGYRELCIWGCVVRAFVIFSGALFSDKSPFLNHLLAPSTTLLSCSVLSDFKKVRNLALRRFVELFSDFK
jgi:hypothetical protein